MARKFAFESGKVSIAFTMCNGLGDCIMRKKVFDAFIKLAPDCLIDVFCVEEKHKVFTKAFYSKSKNLNLILKRDDSYNKIVRKYDLAVNIMGNHYTLLENVIPERLQATLRFA